MDMLNEQLPEDCGQEPKKVERGTPYFRSYYKNYELREVVGDDGIIRSNFVYTGKFYILDLPKAARNFRKVLHIALLIVSVICIAIGGTQISSVNTSKVGMLPMFVLIVLTVLRASAAVFYCISPEKLREWDYKQGVRHLYEYSLLCAFCSGILIVMGTVFFILYGDTQSLLSAALQILCALSALISWRMERKAHWQVTA